MRLKQERVPGGKVKAIPLTWLSLRLESYLDSVLMEKLLQRYEY